MASTEKYHPFRYSLQRRFAKQIASYWSTVVGTAMVPTIGAIEGIQARLQTAYNDALDELPFEERPANLDLLMEEVNRAVTYGGFCAHGRNIFDFEAALVDMFLQTDVGEVPASIIHLPYSVQYLAFGPSPELELPGGRRVDGAYVYVQQLEGGQWLHVDLTTAPDGAIERGPASFIVQQDLGYHLVFQMDSERRLADVVEEALQEEIGDTLAPDSHERDFAQAAIEARDQGLTLTSSRRQGGERRAKKLRAGFPIFRKALNLVVNALCFLTAYPDEATAEWPSDAPPSLVKKADAGKSYKEKRRAESKLLPLGFTRINFCRLHRQGKQSTAAAAGPAKTHWRRGHWRNQPHGEGRSLRKLIWIMPVLVNADAEDHSRLGHVYSVSADGES